MDNHKIISIRQICVLYEVEPDFLAALRESGLIHVIEQDNDLFLEEEHLADFESLWRMHHELEINLAGIEAISHLLARIRELQRRIKD